MDDGIDYSDIEAKYVRQLTRYAVPYDESLDNVIIIDGVPIITQAKQQRLFETIQKRFHTNAEVHMPIENMHIAYGDDGNSKGCVRANQLCRCRARESRCGTAGDPHNGRLCV